MQNGRLFSVVSDPRLAPVAFWPYVGYLIAFTLAPYTFDIEGALSFADRVVERFGGFSDLARLSVWDVSTNLLLYLPVGLLLVPRGSSTRKPAIARVVWVALCSALLSGSLELSQVFLPRHASLGDIACNVTGAVLGALGSLLLQRAPYAGMSTTVNALLKGRHGALIGYAVYLVFTAFVLVAPLPLAPDFKRWASEIEFEFASFEDGQRPLSQSLYSVAVFDRALSFEEVESRFRSGPSVGSQEKPFMRALTLCHRFAVDARDVRCGGRVSTGRDRVRIKDPSRVQWLRPFGIELKGTSLVLASSPEIRPTHSRFQPHIAFSVEAWLDTRAEKHADTVRIVSYSRTPSRNTFSWVQDRVDFLMDLDPVLADAEAKVRHVFIAHSDGVESGFVDGIKRYERYVGHGATVFDAVLAGLGHEFAVPVYSLVLFPLGLGPVNWLAERRKAEMASWIIGFGSAMALLSVRHAWMRAPIDPLLVPIAALTLGASVMVASRLRRSFHAR